MKLENIKLGKRYMIRYRGEVRIGEVVRQEWKHKVVWANLDGMWESVCVREEHVLGPA